MNLLYWIPGKGGGTTVSPERIKRVGLGYAFESKLSNCQCNYGPDKQSGQVVTGGGAMRCGYYADKQTWLKIPGNEFDCWVGMYTDDRPGPGDLARDEQLSGHGVKLMDGNQWLAPAALEYVEFEGQRIPHKCLPGVASINEFGQWINGPVQEQHARLWQVACDFFDQYCGAEIRDNQISFDFQGVLDAAVVALSANYRIGKPEAALLGLFDDKTDCAIEILKALIDWPTLISWTQKKTELEADGIDSSVSPEDSTAAA